MYLHGRRQAEVALERTFKAKYEERNNQQDATIRCLLLTSVSTCLGYHYAHLQENKEPVTAFGVLFWFRWMWLVAVVRRCLAVCDHYEGFCTTELNRNLHSDHRPSYCIWCIVLVLLDVVGSGCGALSCRM